MKPINLGLGNRHFVLGNGYDTKKFEARLLKAIKDANGDATAHTYHFDDICFLVEEAEERCEDIGLPKHARVSAKVRGLSGSAVAKSYKYKRVGTSVLLERRSTGWFLTQIERSTIYAQGGCRVMHLTAKQIDLVQRAHAKLNNYVQQESTK